MRPAPVMLALLLALSPGAVAFQASSPTTQSPAPIQTPSATATTDTVQTTPDGNTTGVMTLASDPERSAFDDPSLALGSSLAADYDSFLTQLSVETLHAQLANTDSARRKKQILNRYRYRIENRIISLEAKERRATRAFSNGTLSKTEYLRTLARIDTEVTEIRELATAMQKQAESVPKFSMGTEANTLRGKLVTLKGPVRDRIARVARGQVSPTKVYVGAAKTGIVLSTITNGKYVREIVRMDRRNPGASDPIEMQAAQTKILNQYPWAWNNSEFWSINTLYGSTSVYRMQFRHTQGQLFVYYDAGTQKVFKEVQHKRLTGEDSLPPGPSVTNSSDNLTLVVNRTYPGGPLRVNLTNETGAPLQGQITVAGEPVGQTKTDGTLWTLGPAKQFRVGATHDDRSVNVTTTPVNSS